MRRLLTRVILSAICCFSAPAVMAQNGYPYAHFDAGIAGVIGHAYTNVPAETYVNLSILNLTYNQTPFVNHLLEVQAGGFHGNDPSGRQYPRKFGNHYVTVALRSQLQLGELLNYEDNGFNNVLKNLYGSVGAGFIYNHMITITRQASATGDVYAGKDNGTDLFIPLKVGYEFKIFDYWNGPTVKFDVGYQYNYIRGDDLDGYSTPNHKDAYSQVVIGLKFGIGAYGQYRKPIAYK